MREPHVLISQHQVKTKPNGGLKAAPSPPQKQHSEHTRQKEVNSTGW
jgi:hypothetical protein